MIARGPTLLAAAVVMLFLPGRLFLALAALLAVLGGSLADGAVVRAAFRGGAVLAALFAAAATGAAVALSSDPGRGLDAGATLLARLLVLGIALGVLARRSDATRILPLARRLGLERAALAIGLSLNVLPHVLQTVHETWTTLVTRSGGRWPALLRTGALAEVLLAHTARLADSAAQAAALRGHAALGAPPARLSTGTRVVVVTGPPGSGKTTAVTAAARALAASGRPVAGFVQPALRETGTTLGFQLMDVASGARAKLATRVPGGNGQEGTRFEFHGAGLDLARASLRGIPPGAVVFADELGPIELRGGGHMDAVRDAMASPRPAAFVLVVRRHLVPSLLAALDARDAIILDLGREGDAVAAILTRVT